MPYIGLVDDADLFKNLKMNRHKIVLIFLCSALFVFFTFACADAYQAKVIPSEISPGDAFLIKITDVKTTELPEGVLDKKPLYFSACGEGCFISVGAVDIETKPGHYTIHIGFDDRKESLSLIVKQTSFPEISLTLPEEKVFLSPENLKRAREEEDKLKSIWQIVSDKSWEGNFILPLENDISTLFGTKRILNQKKISVHKGIDIKGKTGEKVKAANNGKAVLVEELFFGGNTIVLDHGQGIYTIYMHLSRFNVKQGDNVSKGDIVGFVGSSGRASGPHLHFGVKVFNISVNPVSFLLLNL